MNTYVFADAATGGKQDTFAFLFDGPAEQALAVIRKTPGYGQDYIVKQIQPRSGSVFLRHLQPLDIGGNDGGGECFDIEPQVNG